MMCEQNGKEGHTDSPLHAWGWDAHWYELASALGAALTPEADLVPARVIEHQRHTYEVVCYPAGERVRTRVSGAFEYRAINARDFPTAGDWVIIERDSQLIHAVLPRRTAVRRAAAGSETAEQALVANVDVLFLVFGLDGGRNMTAGLIERSLVVATSSGSRPVIVLNKVDLSTKRSLAAARELLDVVAPGVSSVVCSAHTGEGIRELVDTVQPYATVALLGKSGVGKSALLNAIAHAEVAREGRQRTSDRQGRHTTTHKQLYRAGGVVIADIPGLRELQLWADQEDLHGAFPEIEALSRECRFRDCRHDGEPGCRVQEALSLGELSLERFARYREYQKEIAYTNRRRDDRARQEEEQKWRAIGKAIRDFKKLNPKGR